MKKLTTSIMGLALIVSSGCNQGEPGGAVTDNTGSTTSHNAAPASRDSSPGTPMDSTAPIDNATANSDRTVDHSTSKPLFGTQDGTFTLDMPNLSTDITQGETKNVTIGIDRGDNFDQDVTLRLTNIPTGLTITPEQPVLKAGDKEVVLAVAAAADAALGDFTITVSGQPSGTGATATNQFDVTIEEK